MLQKKWSKKTKTDTKFSKKTSKLTRLHLLRDDNLVTRVKRDKIKRISKRELVFGALYFELCIVLQVLQKTDLLAWKVYAKAAIDSVSLERIEDLQLSKLKPSKAQNPDKNLQ